MMRDDRIERRRIDEHPSNLKQERGNTGPCVGPGRRARFKRPDHESELSWKTFGSFEPSSSPRSETDMGMQKRGAMDD